MKTKMWMFLFIYACILRMIFNFVLGNLFQIAIYSLVFIFIYTLMLYKKTKSINFVPVVMADYIFNFYLFAQIFDFNITLIILSILHFALSNLLLYYLIGQKVAINNSKRKAKNSSNIEIDKGIKALENKDYDVAIEAFINAIKEHKENYLAYMGVCNTLKSMNDNDLRKLDYYKKKCMKYAPKELKASINEKY